MDEIKSFKLNEDSRKKLMILWNIFVGLAVLARMVLSSGYVYEYIVNAGYDDQWMVKTAYYMLGRQWMGPYSHVTLIKSLTYPAMLAFFRALGIPYGIGIGMLIVGVSFIFARALKPIVRSTFLRGIIFIVTMYAPFGFLSITSARIYRNSISHWMSLFVIASFIGVYLRKDQRFKTMCKWILCEVVSLAMFWEVREDHIWIAAFVLPASVILLIYWLYHKRKIIRTLIVVVLPFIAVAIMELSIALINYHEYGVFTTNDRTGTYCGKVISLMYKIDDDQVNDQRIWVSNKSLSLARQASPTLDSLGEILDDDWIFWQVYTDYGYEVSGDHAEWALRQAVLDAGYYRDAVSTNEFYKKIYDELSEGFDNGTLKRRKGIFLSSQMKPFVKSDIDMALDLTFKVMDRYIRYDSNGVYVAYTTEGMDEKEKEIFENMLLMNINEYYPKGYREDASIADKAYSVYSDMVMNVLNNIWRIYKQVATFLNYIVVGIVIFMIVSMVYELRQKKFYSFNAFLLIGGIIILLILYTFMICLWALWMTTDPHNVIYWFYGSPGPMLAFVIRILSLAYFGNRIVQIRNSKKNKVENV